MKKKIAYIIFIVILFLLFIWTNKLQTLWLFGMFGIIWLPMFFINRYNAGKIAVKFDIINELKEDPAHFLPASWVCPNTMGFLNSIETMNIINDSLFLSFLRNALSDLFESNVLINSVINGSYIVSSCPNIFSNAFSLHTAPSTVVNSYVSSS